MNHRKAAAALATILLAVTILAPAAPPPEARGSKFTDPRDDQTYRTITIDGITWMARNLNFNGPESYCYDNKPENCDKYGRLYRWESALAACPTGWHLSTEYEWQALELAIGVPFNELHGRANRGTNEGARLKPGGDTGFDNLYAGWRRYEDGTYRALGENAAYWTATESDMEHAWHRDLDTDDDMVWRSRVVKPYALSVRCVQNRHECDQE